MKKKKQIALGAAVAVAVIAAAAATLMANRPRPGSGSREGVAAGATLAAFTLPDQRDGQHAVDEKTRLLLFTTDKEVAKTAFQVLDARDGSYLADRQGAVILDIAPMPGLITRFIAKPRMRRHAFPLLLDTRGEATKDLPTREGRLTLVHLNALRVEKVEFVAGAEELAKALEAMETRVAGSAPAGR